MGSTSSVRSRIAPLFPELVKTPAATRPTPPAQEITELFQRYSRLVLSVARRILWNKCEAEEVVQDVFLYIHLKSSLFNPAKGSEKTWIKQIALSRALDRKSYLMKHGFYAELDTNSIDGLWGRTDLELETTARLNRQYLERAFADLTPKQRSTIQYFYFEGLELREISKELGEPLGNIRHHLYRGLKRLRANAGLMKLR